MITLTWLAGCGDGNVAEPESRDPGGAALLRHDDCDDSHGHGDDDDPPCGLYSSGDLVDVTTIDVYTKRGLERYWDSWLVGLMALGYVDDTVDPEIRNGVATFQVDYCTTDFDGTPILASGMLAMPLTFGTDATVLYSHGTAVTRIDTPSNPNVDEVFDGPTPMVIFAGGGYLYLAPDFSGFGASEAERHRYFHAETEALHVLDMLDAVEDYWLYDLKDDGTLFNMGFSQGGHSALAFAELAEDAGEDIEATAVIGAVADPGAWFEYLTTTVDDPYLQLYAADLIVSYNDVYGDLYTDPSEAFAPPYDETVEGLFDMEHLFFEVAEGLAGSTEELTTVDFYADATDPSGTLRTHLDENRVDGVCLDGPIRMFHSVDDYEVPFTLAEAGQDALDTCNDVDLVELFGLDHLNAWHEAMPQARDWFDTF